MNGSSETVGALRVGAVVVVVLAAALLLSACATGDVTEKSGVGANGTLEPTKTVEPTETPAPALPLKPVISLPPSGTKHSTGEWLMVKVTWPDGGSAKGAKLLVNGRSAADWDYESEDEYQEGYELKQAGTYKLQGVVTDQDGKQVKTPVVTITAVVRPDSDLPIGAYLGQQTSFAVVGVRSSKAEAEKLAADARRKLGDDISFGSDAFDVDYSSHYEFVDGQKVPAGRWMVIQAYDEGEVASGAVQKLQDAGFSAFYTSAVKMCDDPIHMHIFEEGQ